MRIKPVYWIALGLALALTVAVCDGLRLRDKYSIAIGKYEEALTQERVNGKALTTQIAQMTAIVGQKDKEIAEATKQIGHLTDAVGRKDSDLTELVQKLHKLEVSGDLPAQVANLKEQVQAWSEKFSLAQTVIAEKDAIIADWTIKYDAQVTISESWKQKYEGETRLRTLAEKGWKASERKLRWTRIVGNVKTGLVLAAAGYVGYSALKGKAK
jgi:chromosome segregation ATPase